MLASDPATSPPGRQGHPVGGFFQAALLHTVPSVAPTVLISSLRGADMLLLPRSTAPDKLVTRSRP